MKNKKILFINPPGWQKESINLGIAYLSSGLQKAGYSTLTLDVNRFELSDEELGKRVLDFSPSVIGLSVKTATANTGGRIANHLSSIYPDAHFIVGGPHLTLCSESYIRDFPVFEYAILGEGENSVVELIEALYHNKSIDHINGLVYRKNGRIHKNLWRPPDDLDSLPLPDFESIEGFDWQNFRYPILSSRGCPFRCTYCCVNKLTGSRKWRSRSAKNVVDELEYIVQKKGIRAFEVWDDNFTLDIQRAKEICRELISRKLNLSWYCHNGIRADRIDRELADLMKQAGCSSIAFGIESGNPETFDTIKKGESLSAVVQAIKIVKKVGIKAVGYYIIGLPGDTLEKFIETVRFQRTLKLDHYTYGMLIPYPKTEVWDTVHEHGRFFCDITATQHFSNDIVPISFEMPDFPRQDMVRAFYISKFYDLYEVVQQLTDSEQRPTVVYLPDPEILEHPPGMIITCDPRARHLISGNIDKEAFFRLPSSSQIPSEIDIVFTRGISSDLPARNTVLVCQVKAIPRRLLFRNTNKVFINPRLPLHLVVLVQNHLINNWHIPDFFMSLLGYANGMYRSVKLYGMKNIIKTVLTAIKGFRWIR